METPTNQNDKNIDTLDRTITIATHSNQLAMMLIGVWVVGILFLYYLMSGIPKPDFLMPIVEALRAFFSAPYLG